MTPNCPLPCRSVKFISLNTSTMQLEDNVVRSQDHFIYTTLLLLLYTYFITIFISISFSMIHSNQYYISFFVHPGLSYLKWNMSFLTFIHIKVGNFFFSAVSARVFLVEKGSQLSLALLIAPGQPDLSYKVFNLGASESQFFAYWHY